MRREFRFASYRVRRDRRQPGSDGRRFGVGKFPPLPRWVAITARWTIGSAAGLVLVASLHANTLVSPRADRPTRLLVYLLHVGELLGEPELDGPEAACQQAIAARLQRAALNPGRRIPVRVVF